MKIEDLGYSDFFESNRKSLGLDSFAVARVTAEYKEAYKVKNLEGESLAKITGKKMFNALSREDYPAVGDWVAISGTDKEQTIIRGVLPRRTIIKRKKNSKNEIQIIATNIDVAFVIESVNRDFNLNRFERYFAIARDGGVKPVIILNKIDLISKEELDLKLVQIKSRFKDINLISTSIVTNEGLNDLKTYMEKGKTYCFLGSSGVGKSSLINELIGKNIIKTKDISSCADRGKHTTTGREMYFLETGGIVIDNPGIREVGMTDTNEGVDNLFDEITILAKKCKYTDCTHTHEPGCKILPLIRSGKINEERFLNYSRLKKETEHYEMTELELREKDRKFGKFMKKAKKELKKYKY